MTKENQKNYISKTNKKSMFTYVVRTVHDDEEICTYAYPKMSKPSPETFQKYYPVVSDKSFYKREQIGTKESLAKLVKDFSYYSILFYETNEDSEDVPVRFIQTNRSSNANLYKHFLPENVEKKRNNGDLHFCSCIDIPEEQHQVQSSRTDSHEIYDLDKDEKARSLWNPDVFKLISVPPRSRLYLFQYPNFKGRTFVFENKNNSNYIYTIQMMQDDDISSFKWYTMYPFHDKFEMDDNSELFRPKQISVQQQLSESHFQENPDINLPIYTLLSDPNTRTVISKLHEV